MHTTPSRPAIRAGGLRKSFGGKVVLDGIDLDVPEGTVVALLGPNGAGKTTTVEILSTLIGADAGQVRVAGHDVAREPDSVRAAIGVTGQFSAVDNLLTGEENLLLMADLRHLGRREGRRRAAELLEQFDLVEAARKPAATYSGGMRRLDLAMGLVGDPRIVFLDEPTAGLDPHSRRTTWQLVRDLVAGGATIFLTTSTWRRRTSSPTGSRCSTTAGWSPRAPRTSSSAASPAATSACSSPTRTDSTRPPAPSGRRCATTRRSPCRSQATAASSRFGHCWTGSTTPRSTSTAFRCTRPTSTTSSSPSPANPTRRRNPHDEHPCLHGGRLGHDAAPRPAAHVGRGGRVLALVTLALTWLSVALGLVSKTVESASNLPMPLVFLPFLGSGFVPTASMPVGLRWFSTYQPFTPVIETVRGLLLSTAIGYSAVIAVAWCAGITLVGYLWAKKLHNRDPVR